MGIAVIDLADTFDQQGFVVVPSVLSAEEVARLRIVVNAVLDDRGKPKAGGTVLPNAAVMAPEVSWLIAHPPILDAVRTTLRTQDLLFTFEADLHRNYLSSAWHKDTGELQMEGGYFGLSSFGRQDCRVLKIGVYLQDHLDGSGLRVKRGSQRNPEINEGTGQAVESRAGDIVLFDVRITHQGAQASFAENALRAVAQLVPASRRGAAADRMRSRWAALHHRPDRLVVFFAFAINNDLSRNFSQRNMKRQLEHLGSSQVTLPVGLVDALMSAHVEVADIS